MNLKSKKGSLNAGMAFAKGERMIRKFTYKELTIIIGIIVALVIVFAVWSNKEVSGESFGPSIKPKIETNSVNGFAKKVIAQILAFTIQ
ncbi:MAG: hypothetical protein ABI663_09465 [Chryseolinea sp.]